MNQEENKLIVEHRETGKQQDSLELGTPAKMGAIKVYGNFEELEAFKAKIDNALKARSYAQEQLGGTQ